MKIVCDTTNTLDGYSTTCEGDMNLRPLLIFTISTCLIIATRHYIKEYALWCLDQIRMKYEHRSDNTEMHEYSSLCQREIPPVSYASVNERNTDG